MNRMCKFVALAFLAILFSSQLTAQESMYERMKGSLDEHSLPLVNLLVDTSLVDCFSFVEGEMEIADYQRRIDPTADTVRYHCKLRYRGATATEFEKKSFAVKLVDEAGEALDASLFNIRKENSWILDAMAVDRIRMRNRVCFDLWNDLSKTPYATNYDNRNGIEGVFVEVFVNGDYHGLYCLSDKIDRKLLGLKKVKVAEDSTVTVRGLLYKGRQWMDHTDIFLLSYQEDLVDAECWNGWELQYPDNYPSIDTWQPMMDLIDFCSQTTSTRFFRQHYTDYFYIDNLVDYFLLTVVMNVGDNAYKNTFLSTVDVTSSHRYLLTPWDMDMSLGGFYDGRRDESLADIHRYDSIAPFNRLYVHDIDRFRRRIEQKWNMLRFDLFSIQHVEELLDSYANAFVVSGAWAREYEKWNGNPVPLEESIFDELAYVKNWYAQNYDNICSQLSLTQGILSVAQAPSATTHHSYPVYTLGGRRASKGFRGVGVQGEPRFHTVIYGFSR